MSDQVEEFLYTLLTSHSSTGKKNYLVEDCAKQIRQQIGREIIAKLDADSPYSDFPEVSVREICQLEEE